VYHIFGKDHTSRDGSVCLLSNKILCQVELPGAIDITADRSTLPF